MQRKVFCKYMIGSITALLLTSASAFAATAQPQKVTSGTEGVTYGIEQQYSSPADTSRYANIKTAAGCVSILILIGAVPFVINRILKNGQKKENSENAYVNKAHKEAIHRIVDTKQHYRAYIERDTIKGYNLVVVGPNGYWSDTFPDEEAARRFAYENGVEID